MKAHQLPRTALLIAAFCTVLATVPAAAAPCRGQMPRCANLCTVTPCTSAARGAAQRSPHSERRWITLAGRFQRCHQWTGGRMNSMVMAATLLTGSLICPARISAPFK